MFSPKTDLGAAEQDMAAPGRNEAPMMTPAPEDLGAMEQDMAGPGFNEPGQAPSDMSESGISDEDIQMHLDALPDDAKEFLAVHLTPEFVQAIGLISGPQVAQYLSKFVDSSKVLVPLPRQQAEEYLTKLSGEGAQAAPPQGAPSTPPAMPPQSAAPGPVQAGPIPSPAGAPAGGMMAPR